MNIAVKSNLFVSPPPLPVTLTINNDPPLSEFFENKEGWLNVGFR